MTTLRDQLLALADVDRPAVRAGDLTWTWREYVERATARAAWLREQLDPARPFCSSPRTPTVWSVRPSTRAMAMPPRW